MEFLLALLALLLIWISSNLWSLWRNYTASRRSGLPIIICLSDPDNILWMILSVPLRPILEPYLPQFVTDHVKPTIFGWEFRDKYALHTRVGPAFLLVNPGQVELWIADPAIAQIVLARRKDFIQLPIGNKIMGILGPNMITSNGEDWTRQRRLIAPNLNERISQTVWRESSRQAQEMSNYLVSQVNGESKDTIDGLRSIAINVLGEAAYGQPQPWSIGEPQVEQIGSMSYFEAISSIINNLVPAAVMSTKLLRSPVMPASLQRLGQAVDEYPIHTNKMLNKERSLTASGAEERNNLMAMLVRLADQAHGGKDGDSSTLSSPYLTEEEIQGNLFLFTAAGFDTTANTMAYAVTLLATYPEWQDWIAEELDIVLRDAGKMEAVDYGEIFPKLTRCLALMFETLRLYPAVVHLSRSVDRPQTIKTATHTYEIPGPAKVYVNTPTLHCEPSVWGPSSLEFKPTRWFAAEAQKVPDEPEQLVAPGRGTFLPWSAGPRACPGQKMSQVEFVAVIAVLFHNCKVEPVLLEGESKEQAKQRLLDIMQDSQPRLTLQMNRPQDIKLRWITRR